jgi:hypothetical protein
MGADNHGPMPPDTPFRIRPATVDDSPGLPPPEAAYGWPTIESLVE